MESGEETIEPKKSNVWVIVSIIILAVAILGAVGWWWSKNKNSRTNISSTSTTENTTTIKDNWTRSPDIIMKNTTSTSTLKLDDGTLRMYLMKDGKIVYAESKDGRSFDIDTSTGVTEDSGKIISNPAVLKITNGNWIMIFEQAPMKAPGEKEGIPGSKNQRNLYLSTSTDGKRFSKIGVAIDSAKDDNYFASVPDLILLPDGKIRMYYVCGGEATCSAISADGKSWTKEADIRLGERAVDPDVLLNSKNGQTKYIMYFSVLTGADNKLYKATSDDGLVWKKGDVVISPTSNIHTVVDPDVVKISDNKYYMYFGEAKEGGLGGTPGEFNVYLAEMSSDIF